MLQSVLPSARRLAVTIKTDTVSIGPSRELTELTRRFEGEAGSLDDLIAEFSQKAVRAGG